MNREGEELNAERQQMFNDRYAGLFEVLRRHADVVDVVTFWNVSDRDTWLGTSNYPLLFDQNAEPKEAYYLVRDFKAKDRNQRKAEKRAVRASVRKDANRAADEKAALARRNYGKQ